MPIEAHTQKNERENTIFRMKEWEENGINERSTCFRIGFWATNSHSWYGNGIAIRCHITGWFVVTEPSERMNISLGNTRTHNEHNHKYQFTQSEDREFDLTLFAERARTALDISFSFDLLFTRSMIHICSPYPILLSRMIKQMLFSSVCECTTGGGDKTLAHQMSSFHFNEHRQLAENVHEKKRREKTV